MKWIKTCNKNLLNNRKWRIRKHNISLEASCMGWVKQLTTKKNKRIKIKFKTNKVLITSRNIARACILKKSMKKLSMHSREFRRNSRAQTSRNLKWEWINKCKDLFMKLFRMKIYARAGQAGVHTGDKLIWKSKYCET